jgi:hypothetical protein
VFPAQAQGEWASADVQRSAFSVQRSAFSVQLIMLADAELQVFFHFLSKSFPKFPLLKPGVWAQNNDVLACWLIGGIGSAKWNTTTKEPHYEQ